MYPSGNSYLSTLFIRKTITSIANAKAQNTIRCADRSNGGEIKEKDAYGEEAFIRQEEASGEDGTEQAVDLLASTASGVSLGR